MINTRRIVTLALLISQAIVLSIVESWIPISSFIPLPGLKLGLANIISLIAIIFLGFGDALLIVVIRCILSSLFFGGPIVFLFSITGGMLSAAVMALMYKKMSNSFSLIGISVSGAVMHNIGQILMACFVMQTMSVMFYLPVLLVSGIVMGCFVGVCSTYLSSAIRKINIFG